MTVVALWGRKVRQAKVNGDRVAKVAAQQEAVITERVAEVNALATRTERAAVELMRQGDRYLAVGLRR